MSGHKALCSSTCLNNTKRKLSPCLKYFPFLGHPVAGYLFRCPSHWPHSIFDMAIHCPLHLSLSFTNIAHANTNKDILWRFTTNTDHKIINGHFIIQEKSSISGVATFKWNFSPLIVRHDKHENIILRMFINGVHAPCHIES